MKVQHILISTENRSDAEAKKRAEEVKKKLDKGGDFSKLAKEYSDDPGSKEQGVSSRGCRMSLSRSSPRRPAPFPSTN